MLYPARSILAVDVSPFGPSLALLPALRVIRDAYPNAFIAVAGSTGICELLLDAGLVAETIDLGVIKSAGGGSTLQRVFRLIRNARRFNFDLVVDFAPKPETQVLSRLVLRARTVTPLRLPFVIEMLTGGGLKRRAGQTGEYESVLRRLGLTAGDGRIQVTPIPEENARFEELLSRNGFRGGEPIVVLYTGGGTNAWPAASFAETAHRLANNFNARIVAVDEPLDRGFTGALEGLLPKTAIQLAQPRALELMAAVARASVLITDEPNLGRAAAAMSTPVIEVAGTPSRRSTRLRYDSKAPRVTTDEVYEAACEILQESRSTPLFQR